MTRSGFTGIIRISNLRLRTFIGFNPEERLKQQDVVINIEIHHRADDDALRHDDVSAALDYKAVTKAVIRHVEEGRFLLLEKLVHDLVEICRNHPAVTRAVVTVDKPHALRFADSVSLTLAWDEQQTQSESENADESYASPFSKAS
jgi:D-erythro-7,8-dihydroneopterin triphosphate epimerase